MLRVTSRSFAHVLWLFAALFSLASGARAGVGGRISGTVKDASGAVVPTATVSITNAETGVRQILISDNNGAYFFLDVQVGRYNLEVAATASGPISAPESSSMPTAH